MPACSSSRPAHLSTLFAPGTMEQSGLVAPAAALHHQCRREQQALCGASVSFHLAACCSRGHFHQSWLPRSCPHSISNMRDRLTAVSVCGDRYLQMCLELLLPCWLVHERLPGALLARTTLQLHVTSACLIVAQVNSVEHPTASDTQLATSIKLQTLKQVQEEHYVYSCVRSGSWHQLPACG